MILHVDIRWERRRHTEETPANQQTVYELAEPFLVIAFVPNLICFRQTRSSLFMRESN